jgi:trans-2,3-dihydro-3-hydroxyanthranilate isomerase
MRSYVILDVFTRVPLQGNQVAVFEDGTSLSVELMQLAARELSLSETVFLLPGSNGADAHARIFTPSVELPFAGHPVLGAAFFLGDRLGKSAVRLETGSGLISISLTREGERIVFGEMEQPIPTWDPLEHQAELLAALGVRRSELPIEVYRNGPRHVFVALADERTVAELRPNSAALADCGPYCVSCFASSGTSVKSRMFAPGVGVVEDPATGSAAGPLAVHLARHGRIRFGERIEIRQGFEIGRPSILEAVAEGSAERVERVQVGGAAVMVARGEYRLD